MKALTLCHNVSPIKEEEEVWSRHGKAGLDGDSGEEGGENGEAVLFEKDGIIFQRQGDEGGTKVSYQASSPDEVNKRMLVISCTPLNIFLGTYHRYIYMHSVFEGELRAFAISCFQIALVKWTKSMGVTLVERDLKTMEIETPFGTVLKYEILQLFPFTSERKRMGIIVKVRTGEAAALLMEVEMGGGAETV